MKIIYFLTLLIALSLQAEQLKIVAKSFSGDEKEGVTLFKGNVKITKGADELNASTVKVLTNAHHTPIKYVAQGNVSFYIKSENNSIYTGKAGKAIFYPLKKEYHFYKNVNIQQIDEKKQINGEEVIISTIEGKAHAIGSNKKPVIMTFELQEDKK